MPRSYDSHSIKVAVDRLPGFGSLSEMPCRASDHARAAFLVYSYRVYHTKLSEIREWAERSDRLVPGCLPNKFAPRVKGCIPG
jgi:hypothetical protein